MEFLHPEFLYYMALPLVILFAFLITQKESVATFFAQDVIDRLRVSANTLSMKVRNVLFFFVALLLVIALAEPVIPEGKVEIKAKSADIMIALDISDSMLAEDLYPNRLSLAKEKILSLLRLAPNERIGVIAFAKNSYMVSPLSFDHDAVSFLVRKLSTDSITEKGTDFLSMLEVVAKESPKEKQKYILLLSDGGDKSDFSKEIAFAKANSISLFILGLATQNGAPIKQKNGEFIKYNGEILISQLNRDIADLATQTGGVFIASTNASDDIEAMLQEIEAHSEKKELKSQEITRYIPLFYFPLGAALLLLLIATSSMSKRRSVELPSAFVLTLLLSHLQPLDAGMLDFVTLQKAKEAYARGDFNESATLYEQYASEAQTPEAYYNSANALYKSGAFVKARELYKKAAFEEPQMQAQNLANLGNAYAKKPTLENLKSALKAYEESLKLFDDLQTQENLEAVKKAIEEQEQEQEQQEQNEENSDQEQNEKDDSAQNQDKEQQSEQSQQNQQNQEEQNQQESQEQSQENQNQEQDEQAQQEQAQEEQNSNEAEADDLNKSQTQEASDLDQEEPQSDENATQAAAQAMDKSEEMSESEEQKWLQILGEDSGTYLYRMNDTSTREESRDEKPW